MFKNRLFNVFVAIALVIVVALTVREAFATSNVVSQTNAKNEAATSACAIFPLRLSVHTEYSDQQHMWVTYTSQGPTGVDGGLMELLSTYPTCSR